MEYVINKSKIKDIVGDMSLAKDFHDKLNEKVVALVKEAMARAEANTRRTVMARDL